MMIAVETLDYDVRRGGEVPDRREIPPVAIAGKVGVDLGDVVSRWSRDARGLYVKSAVAYMRPPGGR